MKRLAMVLGFLGIAVPPASAQLSTCHVAMELNYAAGEPVLGGDVRVRLTLGAGSIQNGTTVTVRAVRFFLDCKAPDGHGGTYCPAAPCTDEGPVVAYLGDGSITTDCGVAFSTGHAISTAPNKVTFTPSSPIVIPAGNRTFCSLEFDVRILRGSRDSTPNVIEQVAAFRLGDVQCDNGLFPVDIEQTGLGILP